MRACVRACVPVGQRRWRRGKTDDRGADIGRTHVFRHLVRCLSPPAPLRLFAKEMLANFMQSTVYAALNDARIHCTLAAMVRSFTGAHVGNTAIRVEIMLLEGHWRNVEG